MKAGLTPNILLKFVRFVVSLTIRKDNLHLVLVFLINTSFLYIRSTATPLPTCSPPSSARSFSPTSLPLQSSFSSPWPSSSLEYSAMRRKHWGPEPPRNQTHVQVQNKMVKRKMISIFLALYLF